MIAQINKQRLKRQHVEPQHERDNGAPHLPHGKVGAIGETDLGTETGSS